MSRLDGKTAVITGASSGIGLCVAKAFAREGATVVICARGLEKAEIAADSIRSSGAQALALPCDVTSDDSVNTLYEAVARELGPANIVVNSAGYYEISRFLDTSLDVYERTIAVNYLGAVRVIRKFLPDMIGAGHGKIVNIASTAGKWGSMFQAHYNGSKHAVLGITKSLAIEFAKTGVNINAICPGWVETPMFDEGMVQFANAAGMTVEETRKVWLSRVPMGRFLKPEEIGPLAVYLASNESDGMTGQALTISGGMVLI
ncbi:MAG: SDR family oxidoreductase [Gammaproteobacteria bacterium]|jgi:NAD(P)-dependent dehydrogenase (short-subunit alcohol dehydrogenase family)|nr:SDR family oxidoreductase [Gammaproteobacteria bacterium]